MRLFAENTSASGAYLLAMRCAIHFNAYSMEICDDRCDESAMLFLRNNR
jgi:hypothetical protein